MLVAILIGSFIPSFFLSFLLSLSFYPSFSLSFFFVSFILSFFIFLYLFLSYSLSLFLSFFLFLPLSDFLPTQFPSLYLRNLCFHHYQVLSCRHSICLSCIEVENSHPNSTENITCPLCHQVTSLVHGELCQRTREGVCIGNLDVRLSPLRVRPRTCKQRRLNPNQLFASISFDFTV